MKLWAGILLLFAVLASGCQPIEPVAAGSPAMETEPANRATLMLVVNAGSLQEDDDQLGVAHILEHMMFNGTERFPKQALTDYFESVGISFGGDVNAYTSYEETVYFLEFPTDDEEIINTAFQVTEDWAGRATISPEEVDKERGVILEEERLRDQNAFGRLNKQITPFLLGESRYAERNPIGDLEIIRNVPAETLRRFYRDWYRPDLMAVIVVGDIDADAIETKIIQHFSGLPAPQTPRPRLTYSLPDHGDTRYLNPLERRSAWSADAYSASLHSSGSRSRRCESCRGNWVGWTGCGCSLSSFWPS